MGLRDRLIVADAAAGRAGRRTMVERAVLLSLAAVSAAMWAVGVTILQPLSEPEGPDAYGENNTYWARELRWGALIALILMVIVCARGDRRATRAVWAGGLLWFGADLGLDRIDQDSGTMRLAIGAAVVSLAGCAAVRAVSRMPRTGTLLTTATVAAVASGLVTITESPTDIEVALHLGSAAVGSLLASVAVAAAVRAAAVVSPTRVAVGVLLTTVPWLLRYVSPQPSAGRVIGAYAFTVLLVVIVAAIALRRDDHTPVAVIAALVLPVSWLPLTLATIVLRIGAPFTALAANPPVNTADEDVVLILVAIPIGLILGRILWAFASSRPATAPGR
ncbi:hypothetical protein KZ829_18280 [Actinoplanes hulinensis]|uniref:Integral membrane protein n=1 Tax=Actinoplanes hulinensis TaxID=1144547 RepID=A0ABS7B3X6_9ACTN|nr:hypothetical protein [Actinoplanes hulinensis]MBW6435693.1 hypothetical protein [Actinoplanes hulinensis]